MRWGAQVTQRQATRVATGVSALALAALAGIVTQVLVRDDHDNAYLYLLGAGLLLLLPCLGFLLATLLPGRRLHRGATGVALALLGLAGGLGGLLVVAALAIIPFQDYTPPGSASPPDVKTRLMVDHALALALLVLVLPAIAVAVLRTQRAPEGG
jgi:hypothetical protein